MISDSRHAPFDHDEAHDHRELLCLQTYKASSCVYGRVTTVLSGY